MFWAQLLVSTKWENASEVEVKLALIFGGSGTRSLKTRNKPCVGYGCVYSPSEKLVQHRPLGAQLGPFWVCLGPLLGLLSHHVPHTRPIPPTVRPFSVHSCPLLHLHHIIIPLLYTRTTLLLFLRPPVRAKHPDADFLDPISSRLKRRDFYLVETTLFQVREVH